MTGSKILIDSWVWIEYWSKGPHAKEAREHIESRDEAYVSTINLAEIYRWVLASYDEKKAENAIATVLRRCYAVAVVIDTAIEAAKIRHRRQWGLGDSIIYATAKSLGAKVVTGDPHFKEVKDAMFIG
ncbi:MAG: type II toxin-antitoxin system VapC family toxin [Thermoplasmata archaeon]|nr:type II toxin-antitoxin system VapC family toxin [Thermoplasmata archaeon]